MNSINNKSIIKTLEIYLSQYKDIFYKRSFENFKIIIIALLYVQEVRSINFIYDKFIKKYWNVCLNRFYYFLAQKSFNISRLAIATLNVAISLIPILHNTKINYLKLPIQYRLYDKSKTKLEVAADTVIDVAPDLAEYQVIVTCDSWYTKAPFISSIKKFENINIIGDLYSDTAMFDLNIEKLTNVVDLERKVKE